MAQSSEFRAVLVAIMRDLSLTQAALANSADLSTAWVNAMVKRGRLPERGTVLKIAEGLRLEARHRARLFAAAGYTDPRDSQPPVEPSRWADVARHWEQLTPDRERMVRQLLEEPTKLDALAALLGERSRPNPALATA